MSDKAQRLKQARIDAGFASASDAARRLGITPSTYMSHENGNRSFGGEDAQLYSKRFGVSFEWLMLGAGGTPFGAPHIRLRATPIIGTLSLIGWEDRGPLKLRGNFSDNLEVAVLAGYATATWFAVTVSEDGIFPGALAGDHLLCQELDQFDEGDVVVVERARYDGELRQLVAARRITQGGMLRLTLIAKNPDENGRVIEDDSRVLGKIEALYRAL